MKWERQVRSVCRRPLWGQRDDSHWRLPWSLQSAGDTAGRAVWLRAPLLGGSWTQEGDPHGSCGGEWETRSEEALPGPALEG